MTVKLEDVSLDERMARREAAIGTGICADCGGSCNLDKGLCATCHHPRKGRTVEVANPYKNVWAAVENEEIALLNAVRNGTLFVPNWAVLAERHRSTARYLTLKAQGMGVVGGHAALKEAEFHARMADAMEKENDKVVKAMSQKEYRFIVKGD